MSNIQLRSKSYYNSIAFTSRWRCTQTQSAHSGISYSRYHKAQREWRTWLKQSRMEERRSRSSSERNGEVRCIFESASSCEWQQWVWEDGAGNFIRGEAKINLIFGSRHDLRLRLKRNEIEEDARFNFCSSFSFSRNYKTRVLKKEKKNMCLSQAKKHDVFFLEPIFLIN